MSSPDRGDPHRAGCTIGVLALQGDVREHLGALEEVGARGREVRRPPDLEGLDGLIVPGGESTTLSLLLKSSGLLGDLVGRLSEGLAVFGTCAGLVLLADRVLDGREDQVRLGAIDCVVRRNAYGRQAQSFEARLDATGLDRVLEAAGWRGEERGRALPAVFIRAPAIEEVGDGVEVLVTAPGPPGRSEPVPVVARQGSVLVAAFHPELTADRRLHRLFVATVLGHLGGEAAGEPVGIEAAR